MDYLKYWNIEQKSPRWFRTSNGLWRESESDFIEFCDQLHRVYDLGEVIVYVQKVSDISAEIHFGAERNAKVDVTRLLETRDEILQDFDMIFGWLLKQNRGMKKIADQVGMTYQGVKMLNGSYKDKILEWHCHSLDKSSLLIQ